MTQHLLLAKLSALLNEDQLAVDASFGLQPDSYTSTSIKRPTGMFIGISAGE